MASREVHELAVRLTPEGIDDTTSGLEDVDESFDQLGESAEESASKLNLQSKRLLGFMAAITGGLSLAASSLLRQVPVIQESAGALGAVLRSLGLVIDEDLRPRLTETNRILFDTSDAIDEADSTGEAFLETVKGLDRAWQAFLDTTASRKAAQQLESARIFPSLDEVITDVTTLTEKIRELRAETARGRAAENLNDMLSNINVGEALRKLDRVIRKIRELRATTARGRAKAEFEQRVRETVEGAREQQARRPSTPAARFDLGRVDLGRKIGQLIASLQNTQQQITFQVDGRDLVDSTAEYTGSGVANRGR